MSTATPVHEEHEHFAAGKALGLDHVKLGMWLFLVTEVMMFGGFISAFLNYKFKRPDPAAQELLNIPQTSVATFILLTSSLCVALAVDSVRRGNQRGLVRWLTGALALGIGFLGIQGFEYTILALEGLSLSSSLFGTTFFATTGLHGLHVFAGIVWLIFTLRRATRGVYTPANYTGVEIWGLYWHFVDLVWIVLFTVIYLI